MNMGVRTQEVAEMFSLSEDELERESLRAFLLNKLRMFEAELRARCAKFGVSSLEEMEELVRRGEVDEEAILEDFQNVDYLTARISRIKELLERL